MQVATKSPNLEMSETRKINLISPVIKSNSRGARFLDLVKQNKLNVSPQLSKRLSVNKNIKHFMVKNNPKKDDEYLEFSNELPNLNSSPSSSILSKRKAPDQESNVIPDSSPMGNSAKRKRVSFNDPVSTTKEYLITEDEERHKSSNLIRCLVYTDDNAENGEMGEDKGNIKNEEEKAVIKVESDMEPITIKEERPELCLSEDHDYYDQNENPQNTDITTSSIEENNEQLSGEEENNSEKLIFKNKSELMDYITKNVSVDELIENIIKSQVDQESARREEFVGKILQSISSNEMLPLPDSKYSTMTSEQIETTLNIINHISSMMKVNDRIKHKVLDTLSEKHSKDFLTHALQENSVSQVCEKITMPNIINYIIHKVNVCDDNEISYEVNRMNNTIMHHLIKKSSINREIIVDQKETQELLKLLFQNKQKIDVLDQVHEFLRSNIIHGQL